MQEPAKQRLGWCGLGLTGRKVPAGGKSRGKGPEGGRAVLPEAQDTSASRERRPGRGGKRDRQVDSAPSLSVLGI